MAKKLSVVTTAFRRRAKRFLLIHTAATGALWGTAIFYRCPFRALFHLSCPGCGITRAYLAALSGDFAGAFACHPLFFTVAPALLYAVHRHLLPRRLSHRSEAAFLAVGCVLFFLVYLYRILQREI